MRQRRQPSYDVVAQPDDAPVVLVGAPTALRGELHVHNPGEERVVLREAQVLSAPLQASLSSGSTTAVRALMPVILSPGQAQRVPLTVALDPRTPPGEYQGQIEVAGRMRPAVIHVTEVVELEISPAHLVIENAPGATVTKRVVFRNDGNVPLTIGDIGAVPLDDEHAQCRILRAAAATVGDETKHLEDYVAEYVSQARALLSQTSFLRVRSADGAFVLQPSEVRLVELEIRIPDRLDRHSRYLGSAALYTSDLVFVVAPANGGRAQPAPEQRSGRDNPGSS